ncbi:hypothetical protein NC652_019462 [Populus alba x Populus x berolinensis]|nr:hypothetical protein NC652_019462 [Populus alba x Populus x berolinensis]
MFQQAKFLQTLSRFCSSAKGQIFPLDTETSPLSEMLAGFLLPHHCYPSHGGYAISPQQTHQKVSSEVLGMWPFPAPYLYQAQTPVFKNLVRLPVHDVAGNYLFVPLHDQNEGEEPVMVQGALLRIFENIYSDPSFQNQNKHVFADVYANADKSVDYLHRPFHRWNNCLSCCSLAPSYLQSNSPNLSVLCITFGSPLLGNEDPFRAILRERWGANSAMLCQSMI